MKTTKLFFMAALALMMAACSSEDNDITTTPQKSEGVKFTATISTGNSSVTRALSEDTENNKIAATWEVNEEVALVYTIGEITYQTRAYVTAVTDGKATIEATLEATPTGDTPVTLIYPYDAADYENKGNVWLDQLLDQGGTLAAIASKYDVRKGTGTLTVNGTTATLKEAVTMTNQFAIWKITTPESANELCIMADNTPIAGASYGSGTEFYVAVPAVSSKTITVVATDDSNNCYYYSRAGVSLAASKYYKSDLSTSMTLGTDSSADVYKITGSAGATIPAGKTVVFSGVNINGGNITCNGNATIILMGMNSVKMNGPGAGIQAGGSNTTLTITGTGMLDAQAINYIAAGIGTHQGTTCGNIVISGGTIKATGYCSAGIGACDKATCGDITITGGTITARGTYGAAGIGTGLAMGGNSKCGNILISGGTVMAKGDVGDAGGAGIGAGFAKGGNTTCGTITITSGVTIVIATKGTAAPNSIGAGTTSGEFSSTCGTVTIEDGANVIQN